MLNVTINWYGPNPNNAVQRRRLISSIREYCSETTEDFHVFGMIYDPPNRNNFSFFVGNRMFLGTYVDQSLILMEDDDLNIKKLIALLGTEEISYTQLHFVEEFEDYLQNYEN